MGGIFKGLDRVKARTAIVEELKKLLYLTE